MNTAMPSLRTVRFAALSALALSSLTTDAFAQQRRVGPMPSLAPLVEQVAPAVVNISVSGSVPTGNPLSNDPLFRRFFDFEMPDERPFQSAGSGVIIDAENGYLLTNHHVVENASEISITTVDNRSLVATVVGSDAGSDLAVLKVEETDLTEIDFADPDSLAVGDYVVAIGNPFGFSNTVTAGIVSGLGRRGLNPDAYEDFIQTDASINPGNSGGALVNLDGRLVGINSAIISRGGGNIGIGFAIPVDMVRSVMDQLIEFGEVRRGLLGVQIQTLTSDQAETLGLPGTNGALVTAVTAGSAAEQAGIEIDDFITSVDGGPIQDSRELRNTIGLMRPGRRVEVGLLRNGAELTVEAELGTLVADGGSAAAPPPSAAEPVFEGVELTTGAADNGADGLVVTGVEAGSPAAERGLRVGDVITFVNRQRVRSIAEAREITSDTSTIILQVQRGPRALLILLR